jgi:tetratricopeptide (TPR) repeat protein
MQNILYSNNLHINCDEQVSIASRLRSSGQIGECIKYIANKLEAEKHDPRLLLLQGLNFMNTGRLVIAIGYFSKYLNAAPRDGLGSYLIGVCILKYTEYGSAVPYLKRSLRQGYLSTDVYAHLGEAYFRTRRHREAFRCLVTAHYRGNISDKKRVYDFMFRSIDFLKSSRSHNDTADPCQLAVEDLKASLGVDHIVCLGDSHTLIFENIIGLDVYQTGSPTAYNLLNHESSSKSLDHILQILTDYQPSKTALLLTYAEIDIRNHIYKQSILRQMTLMEACSIVAGRYATAIERLASLGYKIMINGPFGSGFGVPRVGCEAIRNTIASYLDEQLHKSSIQNGWIYASLCQVIVNDHRLVNRRYFGDVDDNHLNKKAELCFFILASLLNASRRSRNHQISGQIYADTYNAICFDRDNAVCQPYVSSIVRSRFISATTPGATCNEIIVSLDDHVPVTELALEFETNKTYLELFYTIELLDSQFNVLFSERKRVEGTGIMRHCLSATWTWYIRIALDRKLECVQFKTLAIKNLNSSDLS